MYLFLIRVIQLTGFVMALIVFIIEEGEAACVAKPWKGVDDRARPASSEGTGWVEKSGGG